MAKNFESEMERTTKTEAANRKKPIGWKLLEMPTLPTQSPTISHEMSLKSGWQKSPMFGDMTDGFLRQSVLRQNWKKLRIAYVLISRT